MTNGIKKQAQNLYICVSHENYLDTVTANTGKPINLKERKH